MVRVIIFTTNGMIKFHLYYFDSLNSIDEMEKIKENLTQNDLCKYPNQTQTIKWELVRCLR